MGRFNLSNGLQIESIGTDARGSYFKISGMDEVSRISETVGEGDEYLEPSERSRCRIEWDVIAEEKIQLVENAEFFSITTEKEVYLDAYNALATYLNDNTTLMSGIPYMLMDERMNMTSLIVGDVFRGFWTQYYNKRAILAELIRIRSGTISLVIESSNGTIFKPGENSTTYLTMRAFKGVVEITADIPASDVKWERKSFTPQLSPFDDATWNGLHQFGYKVIEVTTNEVWHRATYTCSINSD